MLIRHFTHVSYAIMLVHMTFVENIRLKQTRGVGLEIDSHLLAHPLLGVRKCLDTVGLIALITAFKNILYGLRVCLNILAISILLRQ